MGQLEDMALFARIVEAGGIGKAAEQLSIAKSAVSKRLTDLEERLGVSLLVRTTRRSNLTDAGHLYYQRSLTILDDVDELNTSASGCKNSLQGTLRIAAPLSFTMLHLNEVIDEFASLNPDLKIHIDFSERQIDLVEEGFELAIRIAQLKDSSLRAKRLTPIRTQLLASPGYLKTAGVPNHPVDLKRHQFLQYASSDRRLPLLTDQKGDEHEMIMPIKKMTANNGEFLMHMATRGKGIVILPTFIAYQALEQGQLVRVLPEYKLPELNAYAVYPQARFLSQRARKFIDFVAEKLGPTPYWDTNLKL